MTKKPTYQELERRATELRRAEEALERERSLLKSVMQATDVMLAYLDPDFHFVWVNAAYAATCNYKPEDMVGKNHFDLYPDAETEAIFRHVRDSGEPLFFKDRAFEFPDQPERGITYWDWSLAPVKNGSGKVQGLVFSLRETTKYKQAEEALRQNELTFRTYFENVAFGAAQIDAAGRFVRVNDRYCEITGYSREELLRMIPTDLDAPDDREASQRFMERFLRGEDELYRVEKRYVRKDGRVIWVLVAATAVRNEEGQFLYSAGIIQDITERKQTEEALRDSEQRFRRLFEDDLTGDFVANGDGKILLCNPAFVRIYGFASREEAVGASFPALKANSRDWLELLERLKSEGRVEGREVSHRRRDGRIIHVVENVVAFFDADGRLTRIQGYVFDDTERKRAEEELRQAKADLEQRVENRTAELAQRAAQLRALAGELTLSEQRERRSIAKVLHDHLQQILVGAKFRTAILGRSMDKVTRKASGEIEVLLDDAINVSRTLTAELSPPILHEGGLVAGLEWLARWMLDKHGLVVDMTVAGPGLPDIADDVRVLLFESVRELLLNAIKHARVRSARVSVRPIGSDQVQIMVSDAGPGFDPAQIKPAGSGGGGFGLFSIRERVGLIGGRMEIDSAPGKGSRFTLIAPVGRPEAVEPSELVPAIKAAVEQAAGGVQSEVGKVIRVLLADDHAVMREGLVRLLGQEPDMEVVGQAADGQEAVELARKLVPDVILMDVAMPKLTGVEATRAISTEYPDICIIGLSMFEKSERAQALRDAGAAAYLTKSGPSEALIATIRQCMARKVKSESLGG